MNHQIQEIPLLTVWRIRRDVMYPEQTIEQAKLADNGRGLHLGLFHNMQICTIISSFENGNELQFRKFATVTAMQGRGFGSALLQHVFKDAKDKKINKIWCNARTTAVPFYERYGILPFGDTREQDGPCL